MCYDLLRFSLCFEICAYRKACPFFSPTPHHYKADWIPTPDHPTAQKDVPPSEMEEWPGLRAVVVS